MVEARQPWLHDLITVLSAPTVILSEQGGQLRGCGAQGVLHANTRVLSEAILEIDGVEPTPVSSGLISAQTALFAAIPRPLAGVAADPAVSLTRQRTVHPGVVEEVVRLVGGPVARHSPQVTIRVTADFAVLPDIKAGRTGPPVAIKATSSGLEWGDDRLTVRLTAPGAIASVEHTGAGLLSWRGLIDGRSEQEVRWLLTVRDSTAIVAGPPAAPGNIQIPRARPGDSADGSASTLPRNDHRPDVHANARGGVWARVSAEAADPRLPRLLARSIGDAAALRMVTTRAPAEVFLAAGAPWYLTLFGRDSIWAARLLLPFGWELARSTLRALAAFQGRRVDPLTGETPGKIPHELRPTQRSARRPGSLPPLYYGSIDATPLWVCLLHDAWRWGMPAVDVRNLLPHMTDALECMRNYGDSDGDGLLEYRDESGKGLANQGWKDSSDAIRFADGRIASAPVTLCEVQGYAYQAAMSGAALLDELAEPGAERWRAWASELADAFRRSFWVTDAGAPYPALALDGCKRKVDSVTSNIGHLLGTGLLTPAEEGRIADRLMTPDMNTGFGLRTMSAASGGYSALSYHCGSVWSHDTAITMLGLARTGHCAAAASLSDGLLEAGAAFDWRLPELFAGFARSEMPWPSAYPASCRPQAWAAAACGALVQAVLGLDVDVPAGVVRVAPPGSTSRPTALHVDGLVAGQETFGAGINSDGNGYVAGLSLAMIPQ